MKAMVPVLPVLAYTSASCVYAVSTSPAQDRLVDLQGLSCVKPGPLEAESGVRLDEPADIEVDHGGGRHQASVAPAPGLLKVSVDRVGLFNHAAEIVDGALGDRETPGHGFDAQQGAVELQLAFSCHFVPDTH